MFFENFEGELPSPPSPSFGPDAVGLWMVATGHGL